MVATLNRPPLNGVPVDGLNRAVTSFAGRDPNVSLVDWQAAAAADPDLLIDGIHTDAEGYAMRAGLFADAIASCSEFGGGSGSTPPAELEHESGELPPPASAGRNTGQGTDGPKPAERSAIRDGHERPRRRDRGRARDRHRQPTSAERCSDRSAGASL